MRLVGTYVWKSFFLDRRSILERSCLCVDLRFILHIIFNTFSLSCYNSSGTTISFMRRMIVVFVEVELTGLLEMLDSQISNGNGSDLQVHLLM